MGLDDLAEFVCGISHEAMPPGVRSHACLVVADLVGAIAAGMREPEMARLAFDIAPSGAEGACSLIGHAASAAPEVAALLHGTAGTFLEVDEGNRFSRGHPGIHVFPAALAIAQQRRASGAALLAALVSGYEVAARIGAASAIRPAMHPHGTWGTVGAAVAVRKLLGGGPAEMARTINVASTLGLATSSTTMREGAIVRNVFAGVAGKLGLLANHLVDAGFGGERDGLRSIYDGVVSTGFSWDRMLDGLGQRWEIARNYFKLHACCRFNHAALDALAAGLRPLSRRVAPAEVEAIEVRTYGLAARLTDAKPASALASKYSLPFALATALVHGSTDVEAFSAHAVANPEVLRLAQKVRVQEDPAMTARLPVLRPARVTVLLASGEQYTGAVESNRGDAEEPFSEEELAGKFMRLVAATWSPAEATVLRQRLLALGSVADVHGLFDFAGGRP
jgi:2-methylcitrate dehydratase PrpD